MKFFFKLLLIIYIIFILNRIKNKNGRYKNSPNISIILFRK